MKRVLLSRGVAQGAEGATVEVSDSVARALANGGAGTVVEDLGADPLPVLPVEVRILRACSAGGGPVAVGAIIRLGERDARLLVALGKAEIISGDVMPAPTVDAGAIMQDAAQNRGPLVRPLGRERVK